MIIKGKDYYKCLKCNDIRIFTDGEWKVLPPAKHKTITRNDNIYIGNSTTCDICKASHDKSKTTS